MKTDDKDSVLGHVINAIELLHLSSSSRADYLFNLML